ncbi:MAG TPA: hypothetical protein DCY13_16930 [Verrucomicrobiales bacterium]|nr:hypothetical protein [Verrucomicrobiales bacterium]
MLSPTLLLIAAIGTVVFFWRIGEAEYDGSPIPAIISFVLWLLGLLVLKFGLLTNLVLQAALFLCLTLYNIHRGPRG